MCGTGESVQRLEGLGGARWCPLGQLEDLFLRTWGERAAGGEGSS